MAAAITEFDRNAVITVQGGGLHALNLLGQLDAALAARLVPIALAGTSAGAIVATLLWAGLTPREARGRIAGMATPSLTGLLGPFQPPPRQGFGFPEFRRMVDDFESAIGGLAGAARKQHFLRRWSANCKILMRLQRLRGAMAPHLARRGLFYGQELERQVDLILRSAPDVERYRGELTDLKEWPDCIRFRHFRQLAETHPECYRPPLFLAATNLTTRRLELFNSVDDWSQSVPVARAVRASAGFPLFFAPTQLMEGGWYVDGGVVSNFPAWVFTHEFRRRMGAVARFRALSVSPWIHVGLRVISDPLGYEALEDPIKYMYSLLAMLSGQARNELEDLLAQRVPRLRLINQPVATCAAPPNSLDFDRIDGTAIAAMYEAGRNFARHALSGLDFSLPPGGAASPLVGELEHLVAAAERIVGSSRPIRFRANVFVPAQDKLVLQYATNMAGDPDEGMVLSIDGGLTGACYTTRCPLICNLEKVHELVDAGSIEPRDLFNMTPEQQAIVEPTRTWLASVPIFDPFDSVTVPPPGTVQMARNEQTRRFGYHYYQLPRQLGSPVDGAVLGVLNLDADWSYGSLGLSPDPESHFAEPRIRGILDMMRASSLRIGHQLGSAFGTAG